MNPFANLIGHAPELQAVLRTAAIAAAVDVTLLIQGESGTGKELLARAVHEASPRKGPFVPIHCAAIPEALVESELFGHRRGAFTGALEDHPGRLSAAQGGTVFLDEVGELPLSVQAKLLRFLENGECQRVGEVRPRRVDVRVIAATHRDLKSMVREGRFREDLYYRLCVVPLILPPLRERTGDIPLLIEALTASLADRHKLPPPRYTREAVKALAAYPWPGNVRELKNLCERMVILFPGKAIDRSNLPREVLEAEGAPGGLAEQEKALIQKALAKAKGNQSQAARLLGISRDALRYRMRKYAL